MGSISVLRAWLRSFSSVNKLHMTSKALNFLNATMLICCTRGKTAIYLTKKDIKQQTKTREGIINDIPEHLGLRTAELDNERLVIEQVLACMSGRSVSNAGTSLDKHHLAEKCLYDYAQGAWGEKKEWINKTISTRWSRWWRCTLLSHL